MPIGATAGSCFQILTLLPVMRVSSTCKTTGQIATTEGSAQCTLSVTRTHKVINLEISILTSQYAEI